jgi:hypothetical protein
MTNEQFLHVSYTLDASFTIALSFCVYRWLSRCHAGVVDAAAAKPWATFLKGSFPFAIVLPGLVGFLSVSYTATGCGDLSYDKVVKDRDILIQKGLDQVSGAFHWTALAVFVWGFLVILILATSPLIRLRNQGKR